MSAEESKAVVRRFIDEVFVKRRVDALDQVVAAGFVPHSWPGVNPGLESLKQVMQKFSAVDKSEISIKVEDLFGEGDKVAARLTLHVVHHGDYFGIPAAGKEHTISETHIFYVAHGKVTEHWRDADHLGMMKQLGAFPVPEKK